MPCSSSGLNCRFRTLIKSWLSEREAWRRGDQCEETLICHLKPRGNPIVKNVLHIQTQPGQFLQISCVIVGRSQVCGNWRTPERVSPPFHQLNFQKWASRMNYLCHWIRTLAEGTKASVPVISDGYA